MNTPSEAPFSLADSLSIVLPYLAPALADEMGRSDLLRHAASIPAIPFALLECRLAQPGPVDLSIGVADDERQKQRLERGLARLADGSRGWDEVMRFVTRWRAAEPGTAGPQTAWFEFDVAGSGPSAPAVFLTLPCPDGDAGPVGAAAWLSAELPELVERWEATLPQGAGGLFAGTMPARATRTARLNVAGFSADAASAWLAAHGSRPPTEPETFEMLFRLGGATILAVDLGDRLGPRFGIECKPTTEEAALQILDFLTRRGLCSGPAAQAVHTWRGCDSPLRAGSWPVHLVLDALASGAAAPSLLVREINHLKIVWDEGVPSEAKIYLSFRHTIASESGRDGRNRAD